MFLIARQAVVHRNDCDRNNCNLTDEDLRSSLVSIVSQHNYPRRNVNLDSNCDRTQLTDCGLSDEDLRRSLVSIVSQHNIPAICVNKLLRLFNTKKCIKLPKDYRSLMHTPRINDISSIQNSKFVYLGIESQMIKMLTKAKVNIHPDVLQNSVDINTDGVLFSENAKCNFWPISIATDLIQPPFMVCCYQGESKPPLEIFERFVDEFVEIQRNGFTYMGKQVYFSLSGNKLVCDSPARCFAVGSRGHNYTYACPRCKVKGQKIGSRMAYLETRNLNMRSSFDSDFFFTDTPLSKIGLNLITDCVFDSMHAVYLGVVKKFMTLLVNGKSKVHLTVEHIQRINEKLKIVSKFAPVEFGRKMRIISFLSQWKAAECRQFLLYVGPFVLMSIVRNEVYYLFLTLHCAIRILVSPIYSIEESRLAYSQKLLTNFVENYKRIFGKEFCGFNIHALIHITEDTVAFL